MDTYCVMSTIIQAAAHWRQGMFELIFFLGRGRGEPNSTLSLCFFTQKSSFFVVFLSPVYLCNYAVVVFPLWQRHIIHALHYVPAILAGQRRLMMQLHRRLDRAEAATLSVTEVLDSKGWPGFSNHICSGLLAVDKNMYMCKIAPHTKMVFLLLLYWCHSNISTLPGQWLKVTHNKHTCPLYLKNDTEFPMLHPWYVTARSCKGLDSKTVQTTFFFPPDLSHLFPTFLQHPSSLPVHLSLF